MTTRKHQLIERAREIVYRNWENGDEVTLFTEISDLITETLEARDKEVKEVLEELKKQNWEGPFGSDQEVCEHKRMKSYNQAMKDIATRLNLN